MPIGVEKKRRVGSTTPIIIVGRGIWVLVVQGWTIPPVLFSFDDWESGVECSWGTRTHRWMVGGATKRGWGGGKQFLISNERVGKITGTSEMRDGPVNVNYGMSRWGHGVENS
eukprot:758760-Hanusia_phi.AAC.1